MTKRSEITVDRLLSDLAESRALAMRIDQPAAANQATQLQGKLVGLMVDRKESGGPGDFATLTTPEQVMEAIRAELGEAAALLLQAAMAKPEEQGEAVAIAGPEAGDTIN